jgi:hypothetical protein
MTREEMWISQMKKAKRAFEIGKEKWFLNQQPGDSRWMDTIQGQSCITLNYTMFLLSIQNMCNQT